MPFYFSYDNEVGIGIALKDLLDNKNVTRQELFITTKVWSNHHTEQSALESVQASLNRLKLDYLDLVLIHWPQTFKTGSERVPKDASGSIILGDPSKENFILAWKGLEKAVKQNLTKSIGVSNFKIEQLDRLLKAATIPPVVNQVECHPFLNQAPLLEFCLNNSIYLEAYSPLMRGNTKLFDNEILKTIAKKYEKSVPQIVLRWQVQRKVVVIPKSSKRTRMAENKNIMDFELTQTEMDQINSLDAKDSTDRIILFEDSKHSPEYPF